MSEKAPRNPCPYCRSPVEPAKSWKECPSCGTVHHADCWAENKGCAVVGCSSGPAATGEAEIVLPPIEEPSPTVVVEVEEDGERRKRTGLTVAAALALVAMTAIGVGAAVVVRDTNRGGSVESTEATAAAVDEGPRHSGVAVKDLDGPRDPRDFTIAQVERGAADVLLRHHRFLEEADGDPSSPAAKRAFGLLSERKQQAEATDAEPGQSGFEYWISKREYENLSIGQAVCLPGSVDIHPPGYWHPETGEAMVYADYGSYAGFTWVLYENGRWTYDAGYGHVDSRSSWESRKEVLFQSTGVSC